MHCNTIQWGALACLNAAKHQRKHLQPGYKPLYRQYWFIVKVCLNCKCSASLHCGPLAHYCSECFGNFHMSTCFKSGRYCTLIHCSLTLLTTGWLLCALMFSQTISVIQRRKCHFIALMSMVYSCSYYYENLRNE